MNRLFIISFVLALAILATFATDETCTSNPFYSFTCADYGVIPMSRVCDGFYDCADESDESCETCKNTKRGHCCPEGNSYPEFYACDDYCDCVGCEDENICEYCTCEYECNRTDEIYYENYTICIPKEWICDGEVDCNDNTDEVGCPVRDCTSEEYKCESGQCIPSDWECDGITDCGDKSDEKYCTLPETLENFKQGELSDRKSVEHVKRKKSYEKMLRERKMKRNDKSLLKKGAKNRRALKKQWLK